MAGEDPEVAELMLPRRRDGRDEPSEQVFGLEQKRLGAVAPGALEGELHAAVGAERDALLRQGRAQEIAAQPLDARAVVALHTLAGVDVDPARHGHRLAARGGVGWSRPVSSVGQQPQRGLSGAGAERRHGMRSVGGDSSWNASLPLAASRTYAPSSTSACACTLRRSALSVRVATV